MFALRWTVYLLAIWTTPHLWWEGHHLLAVACPLFGFLFGVAILRTKEYTDGERQQVEERDGTFRPETLDEWRERRMEEHRFASDEDNAGRGSVAVRVFTGLMVAACVVVLIGAPLAAGHPLIAAGFAMGALVLWSIDG